MTEKMAKVRQSTWDYMRENYPELWEQYGRYCSLPVEDFAEIIYNRQKAHYDLDKGMDAIKSVLNEVYNSKLKEHQ